MTSLTKWFVSFSSMFVREESDFICFDSESLLFKYNNHEWKIEKMFILSDNFSSYIILLIILIILKGLIFLWFKDLFNRSILMFLVFNIIISFLLNCEIDIRWRFIYSIINVCDHLSSSLRNNRRFFIFSTNLSATIMSFLNLWVKLMSHNVDDSSSFFDKYSLIIKNEAILIKTFLFELISNSVIDKKST